MNIALIAHDTKKELMVQFCIAYCSVLAQHSLTATGTTGKLVSEATGLPIQKCLSGTHGGDQQIAARIACNEIDLLLFFRDPISEYREPAYDSIICFAHRPRSLAAGLFCYEPRIAETGEMLFEIMEA